MPYLQLRPYSPVPRAATGPRAPACSPCWPSARLGSRLRWLASRPWSPCSGQSDGWEGCSYDLPH